MSFAGDCTSSKENGRFFPNEPRQRTDMRQNEYEREYESPVTYSHMPKFLSSPRKFEINLKDTVRLPCSVDDLGTYVIVWNKKGKNGVRDTLISAGDVKVSNDKRISILDRFTLEISNVRVEDAGSYECSISTNPMLLQVHEVDVLVPPRIVSQSNGGTLIHQEGDTVELGCVASGNPEPRITWTRKGQKLPSGQESVEGKGITLENVDPSQMGVYICKASNGVGEPMSARIRLEIHYKPKIEVERDWIHTGGVDVQLTCIIHAQPKPQVYWKHDGLELPRHKYISVPEDEKERYTITLRDLKEQDFGNYTCRASNNVGEAQETIEVSGLAHPVNITSSPNGVYRTAYDLRWETFSYSEVRRYRLRYRKAKYNHTIDMPGNWTEFIIHSGDSRGDIHKGARRVTGLDPASVYEVIMQAENGYGWNKFTPPFKFYTLGAEAAASTSGEESRWRTSSLLTILSLSTLLL